MGWKVVVAEDDLVMGRVIHATLEAVGHEVVAVVPTGEEALTLALSAEPEVVVMDVSLAGKMNGIDAAQHIQRRVGCSVIFHTAHTEREHCERMAAIRKAKVITKPGDIRRLVDAVSAVG